MNRRLSTTLSALAATLSMGVAAAQPLPPAPAPTPPPWQLPAPGAAPAAQAPAPAAATAPALPVALPAATPVAQPAPTPAAPKAPLPPVEPGTYGYAMPSIYGPSGLLRVFSADSGPAGTFRFQLQGEYFRATDFLAPADTNTRVGGRFQLGVSPLDWLELFATITGSSNDNNKGVPPLIQVQGDFSFGAKGCYRVSEWLCLGAAGALQFLTGAGDIAFTGGSTSAHLRLLASADLTRLESRLPLRVHFNFGAYLDNSSAIDNPLYNAVQRYALRINQGSRLFVGLGVEAPVSRYVTPFLEYSLEIPVGLTDVPNAAGFSAWPHMLSAGARVFPWRQLSLLAAVDLGITSAGRPGVPSTPPWQLLFGLGWAFDASPAAGGTRVVEKVVEKVIEKEKIVEKRVEVPTPVATSPSTGVLLGAVIDSRTAAPIPDAAIRFLNADYSAVLSSRDKGQFRVPEVRPGRLQLRIEKEGYKSADFEVEMVAGKPTANSFPIDKQEAAAASAIVVGKLSSEAGAPLVGIVEVRDAKTGAVKKLATEPSSGSFVGSFPAGDYNVSARSTGYLSKDKAITLKDKDRLVVDLVLSNEPEKRAARIEGSKIVIEKQINFKKASGKIVGKESFSILDEVVDILARNPQIKKVRIEGHTDNEGGKAYNQKLSTKRAAAVLEYMVKQGITAARLTSEGFGQTKPLVPNSSKKNKAKNRRVEFIIEGQ